MSLDDFCGSTFWDYQRTWNTSDPFFTPCFEETVLIWIPSAFILCLAVFDITLSYSMRRNPIHWNIFTALKLLVSLALGAISVAELFRVRAYMDDFEEIVDVDMYGPAIRIFCFGLAIGLIVISKRRSVRSSAIQFLFWFLLLVCDAIKFRTAVRFYNGNSESKTQSKYLMRILSFPLVVVQVFLFCWADGTWDEYKLSSDPYYTQMCPEKNASYFSKTFYFWYDKMAWFGYRNSLSQNDLWELNDVDKSAEQVPLYFKYWNASVEKNKRSQAKEKKNIPQVSITNTLGNAYGRTFVIAGVLKLVYDLSAFVQPEMLKRLVVHVATSEEQWKGFLYAGVLFTTSILGTLIAAQYNKRMLLIGMRMRTALTCAVYRKALTVSNAAKKESTVGEIVNLMSVDTQRFIDLMPFIHLCWAAPVQIGLCIYFLYAELGPSVFAGLATMVLLIPVNGVMAAKVRALQMIQMGMKDNRIKLMSEILSGIKVLKLYGWEPSFEQQVEDIREKEKKLLRTAAYLNASTVFAFTVAPFLVSIATFATFVKSDPNNVLNAQKAFVSLTLFNIMRMPLTMFPMVIALIVQAGVSVKRLNKYLNSEDIDRAAVSHNPEEEDPIVIDNGTFSWTDEMTTLKDINLRVTKGSLVAVVGTVGSGKSSLLNALLGDLKRQDGTVNTLGSVAYVAQGAWIQNATLRDNILFNDKFNEEKYNNVIDACALRPDLQILAAGDQTEIGEKGINISGGQKQRVALARAAYKLSDIYLLDDPLSAVDSHVGKHIFENLLGPNGLLKEKTRLLVTHGIHYLPQVDQIIVMKDGAISDMGTFTELLRKKGEFAEFLTQHLSSEEADAEDLNPALMEDLENAVGQELLRRNSSKISGRTKREGSLSEGQSEKSVVTTGTSQQAETEKPAAANRLIEEEKAETGNVKLKVFVEYFKASGVMMACVAIILNVVFQALSAYSNIWLSEWSDESTIEEIHTGTVSAKTTDKYLGVYGGLGLAQAISVLVGALTLAIATLRAAITLHSRMLQRILRAPMSFFDTTPLGRLVNRFAKDVDTADLMIPLNIRAFINIFLSVLSTFIVISYTTPVFIAFIVPVAILYVFLQRFYVATSRQLKRLESVSRSPIYSHFGETISGATTIRAFGLERKFVQESERKVDFNQQAYFPFIASNLWISIRLEIIGSFIILFASIFAILARSSNISPGLVGLSISYSLQVTLLLNFLVRMSTELETNIVAVERMLEMTEVPQEAAWRIESAKPNNDWPDQGVVSFDKYETRYREGLDLVLRGITCEIQSGEKIGVVGRTGAGKSSLTLALFRLVEPAGGIIKIDDLDVTQIGLHDLRSKLTIIPQDPVLFSGNVRGNIDPFVAYSDDAVWKCLELAHLKSFVASLPEGLSHEVAEEGQNFSVGQRQLFCLARALLRKSKILVLDEATAAVDLETDDLIQKTIRVEFKESTVITIAHRLNTIMDSDRVMVLDKGQIIEFDSPSKLLQDHRSVFHGMAKDAGLA